jgi:hypothetical protein
LTGYFDGNEMDKNMESWWTQHNITHPTRHDMTWHDMTRQDMTWQNMIRQNMIRQNMTWHDMTRHDMTWHEINLTNKNWRRYIRVGTLQ